MSKDIAHTAVSGSVSIPVSVSDTRDARFPGVMEVVLDTDHQVQQVRGTRSQKEHVMEMFLLVAGIDAVKKAMRDRHEAEPELPPIESRYTAYRYRDERKLGGSTGWEAAAHGTAAPDQERRVA